MEHDHLGLVFSVGQLGGSSRPWNDGRGNVGAGAGDVERALSAEAIAGDDELPSSTSSQTREPARPSRAGGGEARRGRCRAWSSPRTSRRAGSRGISCRRCRRRSHCSQARPVAWRTRARDRTRPSPSGSASPSAAPDRRGVRRKHLPDPHLRTPEEPGSACSFDLLCQLARAWRRYSCCAPCRRASAAAAVSTCPFHSGSAHKSRAAPSAKRSSTIAADVSRSGPGRRRVRGRWRRPWHRARQRKDWLARPAPSRRPADEDRHLAPMCVFSAISRSRATAAFGLIAGEEQIAASDEGPCDSSPSSSAIA